MAIPETYICQQCIYWDGDREGGPLAVGICRRYPEYGGASIEIESTGPPGVGPPGYAGTLTLDRSKIATDLCGEWQNHALIRGGHPVDPPEWP
jgi:hypothetical protein